MDLLQLLIALVVLFALARVGSALVSRFGLPGLIGEIVIGIIIANLAFDGFNLMEMLGLRLPDPMVDINDAGSTNYQIVYTFAELGVIFLLFTVGLETKVKDLMDSGRAALFCAVLGVIIPFIFGFILVMTLGDGHMNHALFLAAAMVATSVGITARIIKDMHLMDTKEARIIIAAAVIDDILGMIVLAIVQGMVQSGELSIVEIAKITIQAVVFVLAIIAVCKWVVPKVYDYFDIAYGADVDKAREIIMSTVMAHPQVIKDGSKSMPLFRFQSLDSSSVKLRVTYVVPDHENYLTISGQIKEAVYRRFRAEGIEIPFNVVDVHVRG